MPAKPPPMSVETTALSAARHSEIDHITIPSQASPLEMTYVESYVHGEGGPDFSSDCLNMTLTESPIMVGEDRG